MIRNHPRRLQPPAPPGALLKRVDELPQRRAPRAEPMDDPDYLALVRQCPCLYCGMEPAGEAAHVRLASAAYGKASGLGKRPHDKWALPVCGTDHRLARHAQHNRNEAEFWASLGINPLMVCEQLYKQRGDFVAMRYVIIKAITDRSAHGTAPAHG